MIRSELLKKLIPIISDQLVVSNIGLPSQELHMLCDQPSNFYMLGTMGLASSIGLGLALAQTAKVIAIDGDGSILTNLGTLPTIANNVAFCPSLLPCRVSQAPVSFFSLDKPVAAHSQCISISKSESSCSSSPSSRGSSRSS